MLLLAAAVLGQGDLDEALRRARERLRDATARPHIARDEWGGPLEPEKLRSFDDLFYRVRKSERVRVESELAALDAAAFAELFKPALASGWSDEELLILFRSVLARGKAPAEAIAEAQRAAGDEGRPLRVRIAAACAAARMGKKSFLPLLIFGARASSEIASSADWLANALRAEQVDDRRRLERFTEEWRLALDEVSETLQRVAEAEGMPKIGPGDWGAVSRWEEWWHASHGPQPMQGQVKDCYGELVWYSRPAWDAAEAGGAVESIVMDDVKATIDSCAPKGRPGRVLADAIGVTYRFRRDGEEIRLLVTVGSLVKEYSYHRETKSWQCAKTMKSLENNGTLILR